MSEEKEKEKLKIDWRRPRSTHFGLFYETMCEGFFNGIEVYQNRFIRGDQKTGNNDIAYKIHGVTGWVDYEKFIKMLKAEDARREPQRKKLREKGINTLAE